MTIIQNCFTCGLQSNSGYALCMTADVLFTCTVDNRQQFIMWVVLIILHQQLMYSTSNSQVFYFITISTSQQEGAGCKPYTAGWVSSVWMYMLCLCVLVSSNRFKTCSSGEAEIALSVGMNVFVCLCVSPVPSLSDSSAKPWIRIIENVLSI